MISLRNSIMAVCAAAAVLIAPAGVAAAEPVGAPLVETTCSYEQLSAAVRVEAPKLADLLSERPNAQTKVREFLALPVSQRKQRIQGVLDRNPEWQREIDEKRNTAEGQDKIAKMQRIADTCHGY